MLNISICGFALYHYLHASQVSGFSIEELLKIKINEANRETERERAGERDRAKCHMK